MESCRYVIAGGGLSAVYAAAAIRERDKEGRLVMVADEGHLPYDRVPLSKGYLLGRVKRESLFPKKEKFFEEQKVEVLKGRRVASLDAKGMRLRLDDGEELAFERLLIATGGRPRKLAIPGSDLKGVHYLRTIDDCEALKLQIERAKTAAVVGGGFIGCELASAFVSRGLDTTILEALPSILSLAFDSDTAHWVEQYFRSRGVKVTTDAVAAQFEGVDGRVSGVKTGRGDIVQADFVVVGVGIIPNTDFAQQAGLNVDRGILVDEHLETSVKGIFAAGDVAKFNHPVFGHPMRLEHYDVAVRHGKIAGANMAGAAESFADMPYFFSYMFDLTINAYGDLSKRDEVIRRGELGKEGFFQFVFADGRLAGFISMNRPFSEIRVAKSILQGRPLLDEVASIRDLSRPLQDFASAAKA